MKKIITLLIIIHIIITGFSYSTQKENVFVKKDLLYAGSTIIEKFPQERHSLDLYIPVGKRLKPLPVVIWIHGGGLFEGSKDDSSPPWREFTKSGFIFCSINYRYTQMERFPAQLHDVKAVVRFLRGNACKYNIDPNKIGVWGFSSGGHLAALMGVTNSDPSMDGNVGKFLKFSSDVQAVCDFYGPVVFEPYKKLGVLTYWYWSWAQLVFGDKVFNKMSKTEDDMKQIEVEKFTKSIYFKNNMMSASPLSYNSFKNIPFLIVHGIDDGMVPIEQSEKLHAFLQSHKINVEFKPVKGMGHGFLNPDKTWRKDLLRIALNFFKYNL